MKNTKQFVALKFNDFQKKLLQNKIDMYIMKLLDFRGEYNGIKKQKN